MAGFGGAYISLARVPQWVDGITNGDGWIALAIVVFASWKPWRVLAGAWLFGGIEVLQLNIQVSKGLPVGILGLIALACLAGLALMIWLTRLNSMKAGRAPEGPRPLVLAFLLLPPVLYAVMLLTGTRLQPIPVDYLSMAPYLITIIVLVIMSAGRSGKGVSKSGGAPACLGQNFHASR